MSKTVKVLAVCLIMLPWQAALAAPGNGITGDIRTAAPGLVYERLKAELERHRHIAAAGGWPEVANGPTIRPGSNDPRLQTLLRRLAISGDLDDDGRWAVAQGYNEALQDAVRRFQLRHGLEPDALVGGATLQALNVPIEKRIDQIRVNLERARWWSDSEVENLILVNVAGFRAYVIRDRKTVWTTKVIVGTTEDKTPLFQATLKSIVFNPTWTVPYSIASEELLPEIKADPGYLAKGRYELFDSDGNVVDPATVDWRPYHSRNFPFTVVQRPGPANLLGQVKFIFPNEYSVCMHDTPSRYLFSKAGRAFSHGCIRVDRPIELAEVLLAGEGWTRQQVDARVRSQATSTVVLAQPLPVFVRYWTAEVSEQGEMYFYDDIYERDAAELASLDKALQTEALRRITP